MHRNKVLIATLTTGGTCEIGHYDCRGSKHYAFRVIPTGEVAEHLGRGRYRWQCGQTGEWLETLSPLASLRKELADLRIAKWAERRAEKEELARLRELAMPQPLAAQLPVPKPKHRGRKQNSATPRRVTFAAAWQKLQKSTYQLAQKLYPESQQDRAESATRGFLKRYKADIEKQCAAMDQAAAVKIISAAAPLT